MIDLAKEIEAASKRYPEVSYAKLSRIAKRFFELGQIDAANKYNEIENNRQRAEEESLGKTLDEAAHQYAWNKQEHHIDFDGDEYLDYGPRYDAFKAGAKWMAEQGAQLIGRIKVNGMGQPYLPPEYIYLSGFELKEGDKVIVQIRKKEESNGKK